MRKRLPTPADVRQAIDDTRRAMKAAAQPPPAEVSAVTWTRANKGACSLCGEEGDAVRPSTAPHVLVCERTLGDLLVETSLPSPSANPILDMIAKWMPPKEGDPAAQPWPDPPGGCDACGRPAGAVARLAAGQDAALCGDCIATAARDHLPEGTRDHFFAGEIQQARLELDDLARMKGQLGIPALKTNPTIALSLVRLTAVPDDVVQKRLAEFVGALDAK